MRQIFKMIPPTIKTMNYLLSAFGLVWLGLGLYTAYLLFTKSRVSKRPETGGGQGTHG